MKKLFLLVLLIVGVSLAVQAQAPCSKGTKFRNCKACGSATSPKGQNLNVLKNRDDAASNPEEVTVAEIRNPANQTGHFDPTQQVSVIGYVASLDKGGFQETCNCGRSDLRDIHINIVAKASERNDKTKFVVVEITPRWQEKLGMDDSAYNAMVAKLKTEIRHKWVKFDGWMMSDTYHITESKNTAKTTTPTCKNPDTDPSPCVWRATTWEVHPVTAYTVVPAP
jgi:cell division protein YceG involved in septum cleavage